MQDMQQLLNEPLIGQTDQAWLDALEKLAEDAGHFQPLSAKHNAAFIDAGKTLLVTFETLKSAQATGKKAHPIGFEMVRQENWSLLSFFSDGDTWFRDPAVYRYIDRLIDDGFFEDFDHVIFYGAGSCGYAACAFSVASPGAQVLALSPQATLDPRVSEWDDRFRSKRSTSFTDRYGYAPDMLDAAERATVIYDPRIELDAMHASLFTRPNVDKLRMRYFGMSLNMRMKRMGIFYPLLSAVGNGAKVPAEFHKLLRKRRRDRAYLLTMLLETEDAKRWPFSIAICDHAWRELSAPRFRNRAKQIRVHLKIKAAVTKAAVQTS